MSNCPKCDTPDAKEYEGVSTKINPNTNRAYGPYHFFKCAACGNKWNADKRPATAGLPREGDQGEKILKGIDELDHKIDVLEILIEDLKEEFKQFTLGFSAKEGKDLTDQDF